MSQETSSGLAIGSPPYMAPEQAAGRTREQGPATDVYALGAILYELLTGRPPLRGETDLETLRLVSDQDPPSLRALRPGLPRDLETICLKCLEKRTDRRYAGAADLAEDLGRCLDGRPIRARRSSPGERLGKWVRRRPVHAALAGVIALSLASGLGVLLWSSAWSRRHIREMHEAVARAERDTQRAERSAHEAHLEVARADERERFAEHHGLASQLKLIHQTFESGNIALAAKMLETHRPAPGRPEPRGFAWGYLRRLFGGEITALGEAEKPEWSPVFELAVGLDGRTIAAGTADGRVVVWDLVDRRLRHALSHQTSGPWRPVYYLALSRDGRFLASGGDSCVVKIWDMASGRELAVLPAQFEGAPVFPGGIFELGFTDTSDCLVVFRRGETPGSFLILFWSVPVDGSPVELKAKLNEARLASLGRAGTVPGPLQPRSGDAAAPWLEYAREHLVMRDGGGTLAIKADATQATLFDLFACRPVARVYGPRDLAALWVRPELTPSGFERARREAHRVFGPADRGGDRALGPYQVFAFSPDGRTLAAYLPGVGAALVDTSSGRILTTHVPAQDRQIIDIAYTPDGRTIVLAGFDPQIHVWRPRPLALAGHAEETWSPTFAPEGTSPRRIAPAAGSTREIWSLAFSPDGTSLASAADDHTIKLWDVATGGERATLEGHGSLVTAVVSSPDGAMLASAGFDGTIRLWKAESGELLATLRGHADPVRTVAFSPDGTTLASAGEDGVIRRWDVSARREFFPPLTGHTEKVHAVVFAPEWTTLFSGSDDRTIRCWDWSAGRIRAVWRTDDRVYALAVSPDGQTLAAAHEGGNVTLRDVLQAKARPPLRGHGGGVLGLAFSPDGLTLASAGRDRTVRLWDPFTAQELLTLRGHEAPVRGVAFSCDGTILATGSDDGAIRLWRASGPPK